VFDYDEIAIQTCMNRQWKIKAANTLLVAPPVVPLHSITVTFSLTNGGTTGIKHTHKSLC